MRSVSNIKQNGIDSVTNEIYKIEVLRQVALDPTLSTQQLRAQNRHIENIHIEGAKIAQVSLSIKYERRSLEERFRGTTISLSIVLSVISVLYLKGLVNRHNSRY